MIEFLSSWAQGIIVAVIIATLIEMILPNSSSKKYVKVVIGMYILFTIVSPIIKKLGGKDINLNTIDIEKYEQQISKSDNTISRKFEDNNTRSIKDIYVSNDIDTIKERWNSLNISKVVSIKGNRLKLLNARIKEYGLGSVYAAIENVKQSDFLKGQNNRNWIINFDWFIRPNNFIKVLEGNYTNRIVKGQQEALQPLERVYEC